MASGEFWTTKVAADRLEVSDVTFLKWARAAGIEPDHTGQGITGVKFWHTDQVAEIARLHERTIGDA